MPLYSARYAYLEGHYMMYRLIFLTGSLRNQRITVEQQPMTIGRDPGCAIAVDDEEMASQHAVLEHRAEGLFIRDLGSMNRILVNKREVRDTRLKHGDSVEIGRTRFLVQALVQAEVSGVGAVTPRRRQWRAVGVAVVIVLAATVAANLRVWRITRSVPGREASMPEVSSPIMTAGNGAAEDAGGPPAAEDLRLVREDLAAIRETVKELTTRAQPVPRVPVAEPAARDVVGEKAAEMFEEALDAIRDGNAPRADQLLAGALILEPDFVSAYEERARLFERRGMPEQAVQQWSEIIARNPATEIYERAVGERLRLSRAINSGAANCVRIVSADQHKVLTAGDYDEMRILKIVLQQRSEDLLLDTESVRVEVTFYDENQNNGVIETTRAVVPQKVLQPDSPWDAGEQKTLTATYLVPRGARGGSQFYGFAVRVLYDGRVQDERARPRTLLRAQDSAGRAAMEDVK
jgi:pSer/pThr/pTyr-binding forkhead associated (FHA) protein